jgi:Fic family protein
VAIGSDRRYVPPPANEIQQCITDLEDYINTESPTDYDPLVKAFLIHYQFEAIHPFSDGNGRIGRVILSPMIGQLCDLQFPWLYLSPYFERYKDEYVENMFRISTEGAWEKWIEFCLNGTINQANDAIHRCERLAELKEEMLKRVRAHCTTRTERIIHGLFSRPLVRTSDLRKELNITYPTAQSDLDILVKAKILTLLEGHWPKAYVAGEIFAIAYDEQD